jgi:BMFP domain-containing protein YqiC
MSNGPNRILDELAKLMTDAAGAAQGLRREAETVFKAQAERLLNSMEVVQREEFEAVRDMAAKARAENQKLAARVAVLEERLAALDGKAAGGEPAESAPKRTTGKAGSKK